MNQTLFFFISAFMLMPFAFASGISLPVEAVTYPLLIGVISVLVVSFFYLKFINKNFSFGRFVKFMGAYIWMWISIWLIFIFLDAMHNIYYSIFLSPHFNEQVPNVIFLFVLTCVSNYLFFVWKKDFKRWLGFTRVDLFIVSIVVFVIELISIVILLFVWLFSLR